MPTKKITAILVDDEISAINTLRGMLEKFCPQVQVLAIASNIDDAFLALQTHQPKLLFLDIEMPPFGKGFDLLNATQNRPFEVIFTTAYPEYAIEAINKVQPLAYLLKPYRVTELVQAVKHAEEKFTQKPNEIALQSTKNQGILIHDSRKGNIVLHFQDILYCQSDEGITNIYSLIDHKNQKVITYKTLKELEAELPEAVFCRTHHSFLVNMAHIVRYERTGRNGYYFLPGNVRGDISVLKMDGFEQKFKEYLKNGG
jgi:two-component system, LytTR family, response regulator